jgi:two-component system, OmpR family, phosphate regulon sensor histidine kinase PhoR
MAERAFVAAACASNSKNGKTADLVSANNFYAAVLAIASHDLRQPLQAIISSQELLGRRLTSVADRDHLKRSQQASARLAEQLDRLLDALHLYQSVGSIRPEPVCLQPVLERLAQQLEAPARRKDVDLRLLPTQAVIISQEVLLDAILRNLVRNALDHSSSGGRVLICCRRRQSQTRIEVRDNGEGIPSDKLETVFEPFFRLDPTRSAGFGLGLFIVKRAADCLEHRIEVRSAPHHGSCFAVVAQSATALDPQPL